MSSEIALQGSQENPDEPVRLFNYDAFADLRELAWDSVKGRIEAAPIKVPADCREIVVSNPLALLTSFTQNRAVAQWIPEPAQQGVIVEHFTHEIFLPYILEEVRLCFQEAKSQMQCFVEDEHAHFQVKMAEIATQWMEKVQCQFRQQVKSTNLLRTRLKAVEEAH